MGCSDVVYVKWGAGIGAGLIVDHQLHTGKHGLAGEFGHLRLNLPESDWAREPCPR